MCGGGGGFRSLWAGAGSGGGQLGAVRETGQLGVVREGHLVRLKYVNWIGMHGRIGDKNNYRNIYTFF